MGYDALDESQYDGLTEAQYDAMVEALLEQWAVELILLDGVMQGDFAIVAKDACLAIDGRAISFAPLCLPGVEWPDDLTGWTITFTATKTQYNISSGTATITQAGVIAQPSGDQGVYVELPSSLTTGLAPGWGTKGYWYDVIATNGSDRATLARGTMSVLTPVSA